MKGTHVTTPQRFAGKVVFITGAARGQGRAEAVKFASEGANIIAVDACAEFASTSYAGATDADLAETVRLVEATGQQIHAAKVDVRDFDGLSAALNAGSLNYLKLRADGTFKAKLTLYAVMKAGKPSVTHYEVVEAFGADALRLAAEEPGVHSPFGGNDPPPLTLMIEAADTDPKPQPSAEDALVRALAEVPDALLIDALVAPPAEAWALRHRVSEALARSGTVMGFDLSVRRSRLPELRAALDERVRSHLPEGAVLVEFGHWGDGGLHANVVFPTGVFGGRPPHAETVAGLRRRIWEVAADLGGSWASEHGWGPTNDEALAAHGDPARLDLLDRIETMLDPKGILGRPRST